MSYEQRKANRQKREKRYRVFIIIIGSILVLIILSSLFTQNAKTTLPIEDIYLKEIELASVLIKNENLFQLKDTKDINKKELEGKRIPIGTKVGNSTILNDLNMLKDELREVESAINTLEKSEKDKVFINNKNILQDEFKNKTEELQESIAYKDYKVIGRLKNDIIEINNKIYELMPQDGLLGQSIENLKEKEEELVKDINQTDSSYISTDSGILSYEIDGYENIYKAKNLENYTYEKIVNNDKDKIENKNSEFIGFKIIDNFEWYLGIAIDDRKLVSKHDIGDSLDINYPFKDEFIKLTGKIVSINNSSNKSVLIIKFNKYLHEFYNDRFTKVKLVEEEIEAFKIPENVILEKDGQKGVYIKDFSGIVKFKPIKIIASKNDYIYIDKGINGLISIGDDKEELATVSNYDEILLKPYKYKEGKIID